MDNFAMRRAIAITCLHQERGILKIKIGIIFDLFPLS
jgi:hypothetical protein